VALRDGARADAARQGRGRLRDHLVNDSSIGHSIDFHAGALAPDQPMRTIAPGASLVYRFTATRAGIWMYHCSSMPMSAHIANGLFGAVVVDPPGLPPVDRSYVLVQSELYLGPQRGGETGRSKDRNRAPDRLHNNHRPHRTLGQAAPLRPLPQPTTSDTNTVQRRDRLGGLLHEYQQIA
jgi:nitrite reductase (NO-forming)